MHGVTANESLNEDNMAKKETVEATPQIELTPAEIQAVMKARESVGQDGGATVAIADLAAALTQALENAKGPQKKTPFNRPRLGPYESKDGTPKPKLRRAMYHHGVDLSELTLTPEDINLLNKLRAGVYCGGHVRVIKRRDRGIDIEYPVRTAAQRLKLSSQFGITSFTELLKRLNDEAAHPEKYKKSEDDFDE